MNSNTGFQSVQKELSDKIESNYYQVINQNEIVLKPKPKDIQPNNDGNYVLKVKTPDLRGICFELEGSNVAAFLKIKKCADDLIVIFNPDDTISLHIIECKSTLNDKEWLKVKGQFEGAFYRFQAICGVIHLNQPIKEIKLYTTYREDKILAEESPAFILGKVEVGNPQSSAKINDWHSSKIQLLDQNLSHEKIRLNVDQDNIGRETLEFRT